MLGLMCHGAIGTLGEASTGVESFEFEHPGGEAKVSARSQQDQGGVRRGGHEEMRAPLDIRVLATPLYC